MLLACIHMTHINTVSPKVTNGSSHAALLFFSIPWNARAHQEFGMMASLAAGPGGHGHPHAPQAWNHAFSLWIQRLLGPKTYLYMELPSVLQIHTFLPRASSLFFTWVIQIPGPVLVAWCSCLDYNAGTKGTVATAWWESSQSSDLTGLRPAPHQYQFQCLEYWAGIHLLYLFAKARLLGSNSLASIRFLVTCFQEQTALFPRHLYSVLSRKWVCKQLQEQKVNSMCPGSKKKRAQSSGH